MESIAGAVLSQSMYLEFGTNGKIETQGVLKT